MLAIDYCEFAIYMLLDDFDTILIEDAKIEYN